MCSGQIIVSEYRGSTDVGVPVLHHHINNVLNKPAKMEICPYTKHTLKLWDCPNELPHCDTTCWHLFCKEKFLFIDSKNFKKAPRPEAKQIAGNHS